MASRTRRKRRGWARALFNSLLTILGFSALIGAVLWLDTANDERLSGRPHVVDGDSLVLDGHRIRLMGIDAPEIGQQCSLNKKDWPCGRAAASALRKRLRNGQTTCRSRGEDKYQRLLAICENQGQEINAWLVESGYAVDYGGYAAEESRARRKQVGIWRGEFEFPQEWRRANRSQTFALSDDVPNLLHRIWIWFNRVGTTQETKGDVL